MMPELSLHFQNRIPSVIRQAQIVFSQRIDKDSIQVVNLAIGNVSLPMHPAMQKRMNELGNSRFSEGIVKYTPSAGTQEARAAFLNIIAAEGIDTSNLFSMVTDGGSAAMELMMLGVCGPSALRPLMLLDPAYTNYIEFSKRLSIPVVTSDREIHDDGTFACLDLNSIESCIEKNLPSALLVIPFDNPTGQFLSQGTLLELARLCVKHGLWLVSDEAYRPLYYGQEEPSSIWALSEQEVPGVSGIRISIESSSKVWNACGLRIGSLITDNEEFHTKAISEYTANLCANALGQEIFGALAHETQDDIQKWYEIQQNYYRSIMVILRKNLIKEIPGLIVTEPEAAIYFIIDFKNICDPSFHASAFVHYCASEGKVALDGNTYTLLLAPMNGFYSDPNKGKTQMRVAMVEPPNLLEKTPLLLAELYSTYQNR
jgi:aspartate aminotransferase